MARYAYDPFGNQIMAVGPVSALNPYRFSSKEWHPNSGLYYYGYRFYEPNLQRWLNQDPIQENGGINLHTFLANNCLGFIDFFGLCNCAQMKKDLENFEQARKKLENMYNHYKPGESFSDYGLGVTATTGGYRAPDFKNYDVCTRAIINEIEHDIGFTTAASIYQVMVGGVGYYSLGIHGLVHGTSAAEQFGLTYIKIELTRNKLLLIKLRQKYIQECICPVLLILGL